MNTPINTETRAEIVRRFLAGETQTALAKEFSISRSSTVAICKAAGAGRRLEPTSTITVRLPRRVLEAAASDGRMLSVVLREWIERGLSASGGGIDACPGCGCTEMLCGHGGVGCVSATEEGGEDE